MTTHRFNTSGIFKKMFYDPEETEELSDFKDFETFSFIQILNKHGFILGDISQFRNLIFKLEQKLPVNHRAVIKNEEPLDNLSNIKNLFKEYPGAKFLICYDFSFNKEQAQLITYKMEKDKKDYPVLCKQNTSGTLKKPIHTALKNINKLLDEREDVINLFFEKNDLSEIEQNNLSDFFIKTSFELEIAFINTLARTEGRTDFLNFEPDINASFKHDIPEQFGNLQQEEKNEPANKEYIQEFAINPTLFIDSRSALITTLTKFTESDFKPDKGTGLDKATKEYKAEYYKGAGLVKQKKYADNSVDLLKDSGQELYLIEDDFKRLEKYIDTDFDEIPKELIEKRGNYVYTQENNEVMNGIISDYSFIESKQPDIKCINPPEIYLTYEDISRGMGTNLTPRVLRQILESLKKFDGLRITNNWSNELEARGLEAEEMFQSYGVSIKGDLPVKAQAKKVSVKLLNFDYVENIRKENTPDKIWNKKENKFVECNGKPGIVIYQYPPLLAYHKATKQLDYIPVEWLNIPGTGNSKEFKRVKRELCKRIRKCIHFSDVNKNKKSRDKRNLDPNRKDKNYNKVILDNLLIEFGGYNFRTYKEGDYIPKKKGNKILTDSNGEEIFVEATAEEARKKNKSIQVLKRKEKNRIIDYLTKLTKVIPEFDGFEINDLDDSIRLFVK